ncbi:MAG: PDGLE domain-containing protein [Micromonosporaceae bacterium]
MTGRTGGRRRLRWFLLAGLLVALLLAGGVSSFASSAPDGLDSVSREGCRYSGEEPSGGRCVARDGQDHEVGGPLADYGIAGIENPYLSTALAGVIGVLLVFGLGAGLFWLARRRRHAVGPPQGGSTDGA